MAKSIAWMGPTRRKASPVDGRPSSDLRESEPQHSVRQWVKSQPYATYENTRWSVREIDRLPKRLYFLSGSDDDMISQPTRIHFFDLQLWTWQHRHYAQLRLRQRRSCRHCFGSQIAG